MEDTGLTYQTLDGKKLDLLGLNAEHKDLVKEFYRMYQETPYAAFNDAVWEDDCMKRMGAKEREGKGFVKRYFIDKEFSQTLIYQLVRDLMDRKGIEEGVIGVDESCRAMDFSENKKVLEDYLK